MKLLPLFLLLALPLFSENEITVDLRDPVFKHGILYTNKGGIIQNKDIRIQARTIQYIHRTEGGKQVDRIEAEGDLMIQYKGRAYIGSELEFDFTQNKGVIYDGRTFSSMWYVGGDKIDLCPDGSYKVSNATITTCENKESSWDLHAGKVGVTKELLSAKRVRFRFFKIPTLWLPSFKVNLAKFKEPIFRYFVNWDKGQGPRAGFRYQLYSWSEFAIYGRLEYRWATGWGGAIETEYLPPGGKISFTTRSYLATDRLETATNRARRYRVQGAYHRTSEDDKTHVMLTWDKYSDVRMPGDFKSEDFEVNTAKKTVFYVHHQEDSLIAAFKLRPRANPFESIKQDLPTFFTAFRPAPLGSSGIISSPFIKLSYLDFAYSDQLAVSLQDFHSARIELRERLFRPCWLGPLVLTPEIGGLALIYSKTQSDQAKALGVFAYGLRAHLHGHRTWGRYKHVVEPYLQYKALTRPTVGPDAHYIFSIQDGYQKIQEVQVGFRNLLYSSRRVGKEPSFTGDVYANAFFSDTEIPQVFPRGYLWLGWRLPSVHLSFYNCWNFRHELLDFSIARCLWTVNEYVAISLEGRYRSKYDWRKADHENFILDVSRSETELLLSPLSDRRITFLAGLFVRPSPFWECQVQAHSGFYRTNEKPYNEVKVDLFTWISSAWKLRLSYSHTDKDDRVTAGISLIKK